MSPGTQIPEVARQQVEIILMGIRCKINGPDLSSNKPISYDVFKSRFEPSTGIEM